MSSLRTSARRTRFAFAVPPAFAVSSSRRWTSSSNASASARGSFTWYARFGTALRGLPPRPGLPLMGRTVTPAEHIDKLRKFSLARNIARPRVEAVLTFKEAGTSLDLADVPNELGLRRRLARHLRPGRG